jgi:hypothetical protein
MFGIEGDPSPEQAETISDAKHLIFEGMLKAVEAGVDAGVTGVLVDEQFGAPKGIPEQARERGLHEGQYDELLNFETSGAYDERQRAALAYAEAIAWHLDTDDAFWDRMHAHFSEPELVELGCAIALTLGQQSWLRMLNIDHHEVMPGTSASMAPGFETREALEASKASAGYWAARAEA